MTGNTAAPSGTSSSDLAAILASGHGGDDRQFIAVLDGGGEIVEIPNIFVVKVKVNVLADLPPVEELGLECGKPLAEVIENRLHSGPRCFHHRLVVGLGSHWGGDVDFDRHTFS